MSNISICQQFAPDTPTIAYTAERPTIIDAAVVCNPTAADAVLSVWVAQDGGTQADDNIIYDEKSIAAGTTEVLDALHGLSMVTGARLVLLSDTASALAVTVTGRR